MSWPLTFKVASQETLKLLSFLKHVLQQWRMFGVVQWPSFSKTQRKSYVGLKFGIVVKCVLSSERYSVISNDPTPSYFLQVPAESREMKTPSLVFLLLLASGACDDVKYISKRNSGRGWTALGVSLSPRQRLLEMSLSRLFELFFLEVLVFWGFVFHSHPLSLQTAFSR